MVGIGEGQAARLNVVNVVNVPNVVNTSGANNPVQFACQLDLAFLDSQGNNIKQSTVSSLNPGQAAYLDLDWSEISGASPRAEIRGAVTTHLPGIQPLGGSKSPVMQGLGCNVIPTLEVFDDDTGKTTVILSGPEIPGWPVPLAVTATSSSK